jgi:hypothetical protein
VYHTHTQNYIPSINTIRKSKSPGYGRITIVAVSMTIAIAITMA